MIDTDNPLVTRVIDRPEDHLVSMNPSAHYRSSWNEQRFIVRGKLTDKKIETYQKRGYYSAEYREARKKLMDAKAAKRAKRDGNFEVVDGRMIYSPV